MNATNPLAHEDVVRNRIRREVQAEVEARLRQSHGVHRWWLILRREAEIFRRAGKVIHRR